MKRVNQEAKLQCGRRILVFDRRLMEVPTGVLRQFHAVGSQAEIPSSSHEMLAFCAIYDIYLVDGQATALEARRRRDAVVIAVIAVVKGPDRGLQTTLPIGAYSTPP